MNDIIRTTLYTGVGTAVLAKAKFKEFVEELIQNNELTQEEGQRIILANINALEDKKIELETKVLKAIDGLLLNLKLPPRNELELKFDDLISILKQQKGFSFFKQKLDSTPTTR